MSTQPDIKTFSAAVLLSTATGLSLPSVPFSSLHEAIEHLLGEPVWTHQFTSPELWARAREALIAQHPAFANVDGNALRSACEGKSADERNSIARAWADNQASLLGATEFALTRGSGRSPDVAQDNAMAELLVDVEGGAS
jgi:hypothetical protein